MQREMVIARYCENLEWLSELGGWHIHLYDKSEISNHIFPQSASERLQSHSTT